MGFNKTFLCFAFAQPPASLKYPKYEGCIEFSSVNDKVISLYNFQKAVGINPEPPCKRYDLVLNRKENILTILQIVEVIDKGCLSF